MTYKTTNLRPQILFISFNSVSKEISCNDELHYGNVPFGQDGPKSLHYQLSIADEKDES